MTRQPPILTYMLLTEYRVTPGQIPKAHYELRTTPIDKFSKVAEDAMNALRLFSACEAEGHHPEYARPISWVPTLRKQLSTIPIEFARLVNLVKSVVDDTQMPADGAPFTDEELRVLSDTRSKREWDAAMDKIRHTRGGGEPSDEWQQIFTSGFLARVVSKWTEDLTDEPTRPC